jgi:hypothetical protein
MKKLLVTLLLALAPVVASAQTKPPAELVGDWKGILEREQGPLPIVVHIGDHVTLDSPDQKAFGLTGIYGMNGANYRIDIPTAGLAYEGRLTDAQTLDGVLYQGGDTPKLRFTRTSTTPTFPTAPPAPPKAP